MAKRGPTPQPAAIKKAKGTSRRRIGEDPPQVKASPGSGVSPPAWLKKKRGLDVWNRLAPKLTRLKLLTDTDAETFARYCRNYQTWLDCQDYCDKKGVHYETDSGYDRMRSAMMISLRLESVLERSEDRFGLNPAERQRIYAARANAGGAIGDLFGNGKAAASDAATPAEKPAENNAPASPVGFLQ